LGRFKDLKGAGDGQRMKVSRPRGTKNPKWDKLEDSNAGIKTSKQRKALGRWRTLKILHED
jgi:hypothetical protein